MIKKVFSIYDKKSKLYNQPFMDVAIGPAERNFRMLVNDGKSIPGQFPDDFELYYIADYQEETGSYKSLEEKVRVCGASDVKEKKDDEVCHTVQST